MATKTKEKKTTKSAPAKKAVKKETKKVSESKKKATTKATKKKEVTKKIASTPKEEIGTVGMKLEDVKEENRSYTTIGEYSEEIELKHKNKKSESEREYELYKKLVKFQKNNQLLWGVIDSVEWQQFSNRKMMTVCVNWNGIKIIIPDDWFWLEGMTFGNSYSRRVIPRSDGSTEIRETSSEEKANIRYGVAKFYINAEVCFTIKGVSRRPIENNEAFKGSYLVSALGNRVEACNILKDKYFFHKNHLSTKEPITVKPGDTVEAHVIGVKEDCVLVEACGVETRLDCFTLSNELVKNCMDEVKPGDERDLIVKNLEIIDGHVQLSLTGRTTATPKSILQMHVRSYYSGCVVRYNEKSNIYTVALKNGVRACIHKDRVEGYLDLAYGDQVRVFVTSIKEAFVVGYCIKV